MSELPPLHMLPHVIGRDQMKPYVERVLTLEARLSLQAQVVVGLQKRIVSQATLAAEALERYNHGDSPDALVQALRDIISDARRPTRELQADDRQQDGHL